MQRETFNLPFTAKLARAAIASILTPIELDPARVIKTGNPFKLSIVTLLLELTARLARALADCLWTLSLSVRATLMRHSMPPSLAIKT